MPPPHGAVSPKAIDPGKARRWIAILLPTCAILTLPWMLLAVLAVARDDSAAAQRALSRDTRSLAARQYPRRTHAPPWIPGSFGEGVQPYLPILIEAYEAWDAQPKEVQRVLREVIRLELPVASLPAEAQLDRLRPAVEGMLLATHRGRGDPPERFEGFRSLTVSALVHGGMLGLVLLAHQLEEGAPEAALSTCLDALALGRDLAFGTSLMPRSLGAGIQSLALPGCAAAIARSSVAAQRLALDAILTIRQGLPPFSDTVFVDQVINELHVFAFAISELDALPPEAREIVLQARASVGSKHWAAPWISRDGWSEWLRLRPDLEWIGAWPEVEQARWFKVHRTSSMLSLNPIVSSRLPDYEGHVARSLGGRRSLNALALATVFELHRDRFGTYPRSSEALPEYETIFEDEPSIELQFEDDGIKFCLLVSRTTERCFRLTSP